MTPIEKRAIKFIHDCGLGPKSQLGQKVKTEAMKMLEEKAVCPVCELRKLDPSTSSDSASRN